MTLDGQNEKQAITPPWCEAKAVRICHEAGMTDARGVIEGPAGTGVLVFGIEGLNRIQPGSVKGIGGRVRPTGVRGMTGGVAMIGETAADEAVLPVASVFYVTYTFR